MALKYRDILMFLFDYFYNIKQFEILFKIHSYFVMFNDYKQQDQMEISILKLLSSINADENLIIVKNL